MEAKRNICGGTLHFLKEFLISDFFFLIVFESLLTFGIKLWYRNWIKYCGDKWFFFYYSACVRVCVCVCCNAVLEITWTQGDWRKKRSIQEWSADSCFILFPSPQLVLETPAGVHCYTKRWRKKVWQISGKAKHDCKPKYQHQTIGTWKSKCIIVQQNTRHVEVFNNSRSSICRSCCLKQNGYRVNSSKHYNPWRDIPLPPPRPHAARGCLAHSKR